MKLGRRIEFGTEKKWDIGSEPMGAAAGNGPEAITRPSRPARGRD